MSDSKPPASVLAAETAPAAAGPAFMPKETVNVIIGKQNANLYPRVQPMWPIEERAYAYHVTSTALKNLHLPSDVYIDNLGIYLDCQTVVAGLKTDFTYYFKENWLSMDKLDLLSFHNSAGAVIADATIAGDPTILKPVQDGNIPNCRPADVRYIRLQLQLDFVDLATGAGPNDNTVLRCQYYLELPQTMVVVNDGHGHPRNLVTFHGADNLRDLSIQEIQDDILAHVPQDSPIGLAEAPFNVTNAVVDETVMESIQRSILKLAITTIEKEVFQHLCPGYTAKPHAAVENITQTYPDDAGNIVTLTVSQYSSILQNAARTFAHLQEYPCDLCTIFMNGLHPDVKAVFQDQYDRHSEPHDRNGRAQRTAYAEILKLATKAESMVQATQKLVARQVGQSFNTDVLASQAERTLSHYKRNTGTGLKPSESLGKGHKCHGCGAEDHPFSSCPNKDKPGVAARAKRNREKFFDEKGKGKKGRWQRKAPNLADMSPSVRAKITQQVLEQQDVTTNEASKDNSSVNSSLTGPATPSSSRGRGAPRSNVTGGPFIFIGDVLTLKNSTKEILPVPINTALPHILLQLGASDMKGESPAISCVVDTAAALSTGNSHFLFHIAKTFPGTVAAIYTSEQYSGITLSGVVQRNGEAVTTELSVAFLFNLPYYTVDGQPAQVMFGAGPHVNVNCILGTPFLTATRMIVDFGDGVAECRGLDVQPFPLDYKRARLALPNVQASMVTGHDPTKYSSFLAELEALEAYVHCVDAVPSTRNLSKRVRWTPPKARHPTSDGPSHYRPPPAHGLPGNVLPRDSLTNFNDLAGESHSAGSDNDELVCNTLSRAGWRSNSASSYLHSSGLPAINPSRDSSSSYEDSPTGQLQHHSHHLDSSSNSEDDAALSALTPPVMPPDLESGPIRPAMKPKKGRKRKNVFTDDRGFPDPSDEYDTLLRNIDGGTVLRKRLHPARPLDEIDPAFNVQYNEAKHGEQFKRDFKPSPLLTEEENRQLADLIKEFWPVFDDAGLFIPVKDYECEIDTGTAAPIAVKGIKYGPYETPIMRKCVATLQKLGHISQTRFGAWLFKALLAPKPHQEHILDIDDFVWRFCVNYIPLNAVTRVIAYPIPRCDSAVYVAFGSSILFWLMDAPQGYHQIRVAKNSRHKLAFQGPDAIKWTWNVMPFGPVNGPSIFIDFMHDMDSTWKQLAIKREVPVGDDCNTRLIVDDLLNFAQTFKIAMAYLRCQLQVAQSQNLSFKLKKCHWFPKRLEFVGVDVTVDGNRPAQSKHNLLETWPTPLIIRDVASFVGFAVFYANYIPLFELRITRLRELMKMEYTETVAPHWDAAAQSEFDDIRLALLSDPCLKRFDARKRVYLLTDFSKHGFGYCATQPGDDPPSLAAMRREMEGGPCEFMLPPTELQLHPIAFGSRRTRGNEKILHSHLGEMYAGDWAINKCSHYCFGLQFTWVTDGWGVRFIFTYDGSNGPILRLQMRLMCWNCTVVHRPGTLMISPDYFSRLGADLCFDPFLKDYVQRVAAIKAADPAVSTLPIKPENMPGYRQKRSSSASAPPDSPAAPSVDIAAANILSEIYLADSNGHGGVLSNVPIQFGCFGVDVDLPTVYKSAPLYNNDLVFAARVITHFQWAIYSFNSGHFAATSLTQALPFRVVLAADAFSEGRALLKEFAQCPLILNGAKELYDHVRKSGDTSKLDGYLIHSHRFPTSASTRTFWQLQASIISEMRKIRNLSLFVAFVHLDHDGRPVGLFAKALQSQGWVISDTFVYFPDFGDSVAGSSRLIIGVHSETDSTVSPINIPTPPPTTPAPIQRYLWAPFNKMEYAVSLSPSSDRFNNDDSFTKMTQSEPKAPPSSSHSSYPRVLYCLHNTGTDESIQSGSQVYSVHNVCPPFNSTSNENMFQHHFGIEFQLSNEQYVRPISPFEFVRCFNLPDDYTYKLSHTSNKFCLDGAIPAFTSSNIFQVCYDRLDQIRSANLQLFEPNSPCARAALSNVFVNGAVGARLPDADKWIQAYQADEATSLIIRLIKNPGLITNEILQKLHHSLRMPLRHQLLILENDMIVYREPLGDGSNSYCKLRLVPESLKNAIFVAFHANPIGGHFNHVRTYRNIRLRYFWPEMYKYCKEMCSKCPACALANRTHSRAKELVYGFPITAPMMVLHADGYQAGAAATFDGDSMFLVCACGMTSFGVLEPVKSKDAKGFAASLMRVLLRFGLCHTLVLDKDSKFFGVFREVVDLLNLNYHVLSSENHDAMLVERLNRFLNKGLKVMTNERDSVRIATEALLLLIYAWNSAPVIGTDLPRSLIVTGRVFSFPIDFSVSKHLDLTSSPAAVQSYAKDQATLLSASRDIYRVLIEEHRSWHREWVNSNRPDPRQYEIGDIVFARRATRSDAKKDRVGKLMYPMTGPWRVIEKLDGGSYRLEHCQSSGRFEKKHASMLSPYPLELIPFQPVDGPDNRYSQLFRPIGKNPFKEAGIKGFDPPAPFKLPANFLQPHVPEEFYWPTLSELNEECQPFPWTTGEQDRVFQDNSIQEDPVMYQGPPPDPPIRATPSLPDISTLAASIISSADRLFFISVAVSPSYKEWRLVRVILDDSISLHPACLQDGRFLVEFYVRHADDLRYNSINQRYWLQYHKAEDLRAPLDSTHTHLVRPSDTSPTFALRNNLQTLRQWVHLTHEDVYLHGPFDFATVNGRKTRDRVSIDDWKILLSLRDSYHSTPPSLDLPTYSIHFDRGVTTTFVCKTINAHVQSVASLLQTSGDRMHC